MTGKTHVGAFSCLRQFLPDHDDAEAEFGPFDTTNAFFRSLIGKARQMNNRPELAALQLFIGALPDYRFDGSPFHFAVPDFDSQNILVDDGGEVAGIIDWDNICIYPRELGALTYPAWITVDPMMYDMYQDQPNCDSESDLHGYRTMYTNAIDRASQGRLGVVTRNSHVVQALFDAAGTLSPTTMTHLAKYVWGSNGLTFEVIEAIGHCAWYSQKPTDIARVVGEHSLPVLCQAGWLGAIEWDKYGSSEDEDMAEQPERAADDDAVKTASQDELT